MSAMTKEEREALTDFSKKWGPLLGNNASNSTIMVHGASSWQLTACLLAAAVGLCFGAFGLYIAADTRNQGRASEMELRQDIKAIRAYINAGMVRPKEK